MSACAQFKAVFLEPIEILTQPPEPRWRTAAQLVASATDALGGAHLDEFADTSAATFQAFVRHRYPADYKPHAEQLYKVLRCGLLHAARTDIHGKNLTNPGLKPIALTHRDLKPFDNTVDGSLVISVPHLCKALTEAFDDFAANPTPDEHTNFPLRFEISLGASWGVEYSVDPEGAIMPTSPSASAG